MYTGRIRNTMPKRITKEALATFRQSSPTCLTLRSFLFSFTFRLTHPHPYSTLTACLESTALCPKYFSSNLLGPTNKRKRLDASRKAEKVEKYNRLNVTTCALTFPLFVGFVVMANDKLISCCCCWLLPPHLHPPSSNIQIHIYVHRN